MLEQINQWDIDFFLFLNGFYNDLWDRWMVLITQPKYWSWFFLGITGLFIYFKKKESWQYLLTLVIALIVSDHIASSIFKPFFERLRPCYNEAISSLIHQPSGYGCGGKYGFFSSHASTSFGLATFIYLALKKELKYYSILFFGWALFYSYSRIYLGKHYPLDILCGAICGSLVSILFYSILQEIRHKKSRA